MPDPGLLASRPAAAMTIDDWVDLFTAYGRRRASGRGSPRLDVAFHAGAALMSLPFADRAAAERERKANDWSVAEAKRFAALGEVLMPAVAGMPWIEAVERLLHMCRCRVGLEVDPDLSVVTDDVLARFREEVADAMLREVARGDLAPAS